MSAEHQRKYKERYPERVKESARKFRERNRDAIRKLGKAWKSKNRELVKKYKIKNEQKYPEKVRARRILNDATRTGKLIKPHTCSDCKAVAEIGAHHEDYSKPLDVLWLCRQCHALRHKGETR